MFWHDDVAVGDFVLVFFLLRRRLLLKQSELVWSDLKWLSNLSALLDPEKTCMCGIGPVSKSGVLQQDGSQLQKHWERWDSSSHGTKPALGSTSDSEAEQKVGCHCNRVQNGPL